MPIFKKLQSIVDQYDTTTGMDLAIDKPYLILLVEVGDEDTTHGEFVAIKGRKDAYNYLTTYGINGNYNILKSFILSGGITFGNEVSIYTFCRMCVENYQYDSVDTLDYLNTMARNTALDNDQEYIDDAWLERFYRQELNAKAK